jgi:hypothetical protein
VTQDQPTSRAAFAETLAEPVGAGRKVMLIAPLGAGKTHTLFEVRDRLQGNSTPCAYIDLFTAASTPECLLTILGEAARPFMGAAGGTVANLVAEGKADRHQSSSALLRLLKLMETHPPAPPFVWLIDEATEIRSLAYFPELSRVEEPFARALGAAPGAVLSSSYMGLATALFPDFETETLPGLTPEDLNSVASLRSDGGAVALAIALTNGAAATLLPLLADMRDTRNAQSSLVRLLRPGGALESACRRQYEVLLLRSRGYAVSKRAAEVVGRAGGQRLTDLYPRIGRTPGASRQYLRWLVEVGLLTQVKKRYDFADPMVGLWASLYLGRGDLPSLDEIETAVQQCASAARAPQSGLGRETEVEPGPKRRVELLEEID